MSVHIEAKPGEIANKVLLSGGPLRAKYVTRISLENPVCYDQARGVSGYAGTYKGQRVSIQGTGMGVPSADIYAHELINSYDMKKLIRVGTCGSTPEKVSVRELVAIQAAATPSSAIRNDFPKYGFPQIVSSDLLPESHEIAKAKSFITHVDSVLSDDVFYRDSLNDVFHLGRYGVLAIETEAIMLYYLTAKFDVEVLTAMTVNGGLVTDEKATAERRQTTSNEMIEADLETATVNRRNAWMRTIIQAFF